MVLSTILLSAFSFSGDAPPSKVIRIAGDNNFPPFEYFAQTGVYSGFNVDIMNAISLETGMKIEFVPLPWNEALTALQTGKVDAIQGMKYSPTRDLTYNFSDSYFTSSQGIFVRSDNMTIFQIRDLDGKRVAIQKGDIASDLLQEHHQASFFMTHSQEEAVQLLLDGEVDAFVGNRITGQYFLQKSNRQDQIKIVGDPVNPTDYGVAVMPPNDKLLDVFNQGIDKIKKNGTYDKIEQRWFGEYIMPRSPGMQRILIYLQWGLAIIVLIFLVVIWWNRMLKKEVQRRTVQVNVMNQQLQEKMGLLEENVQFQQQLLDSTYSSYVTLLQDGRVSLVNRRAISYLGVDGPLIGRPFEKTILSQFIPGDVVNDVLTVGATCSQQETIWERETDGQKQQRVIRFSIYPIIAVTKEITGAIINFLDVTEQKEMEQKIEREDRLRSLGQLMLGVAHEIRNPLTSILTYTQLLPTKFDNPKFREFFSQQVPSEILRLNGLVTDLLDYAKPKPPSPARFRAAELLEAVLHLCNPKIKERKIIVSLQVADDLFIHADQNQVKQVWINVILNAVESMAEGRQLVIRGFSEGNEAVLEVEDEGHGISTEEKYRIFDPFYTTKEKGVGLGLSISYQLIKENGGTIDVHSQQGSGTTMVIRLPQA